MYLSKSFLVTTILSSFFSMAVAILFFPKLPDLLGVGDSLEIFLEADFLDD
jgi:hypothetical protein